MEEATREAARLLAEEEQQEKDHAYREAAVRAAREKVCVATECEVMIIWEA
jgi:hypothetical protein